MALPEILPKLRSGLIIDEADTDFNGEMTYLVSDNVANKTFYIGERELHILQKWQATTPEKLLNVLNKELTSSISLEELENIYNFLFNNHLLEKDYLSIKNSRYTIRGIAHLIVHYLFFMHFTVAKPDKFLSKTYPSLAWIFSARFAKIVAGLLLVVIFLISRQFDAFSHTFFKLTSLKYCAFYLCGLFITKFIHELGHAYACKRFGLPVPTISLAFVVFYPMLYTDTSASWKIKNSKDRMLISLAGIWVELCLAVVALWLWVLFPDGMLRSVFFFFGVLNILATILINLNPLVKFDGYYVLSDLLRIRNLHARSFDLAQWKINEWLWGWKRNPPEKLPSKRAGFLIGYAFLAWLYRVVLCVTVAIMVYNMFFKILGIFLFALEIFYFIILPIKHEITFWVRNKQDIHWNTNTKVSAGVMLLFALAVLMPHKADISLPATFFYNHQYIFVPEVAKIKTIHQQNQAQVKPGELLFELTSPKVDFHIAKSQATIKRLQARLRHHAHLADSLDNYHIAKEEIALEKVNLASWQHKKQKLEIRAPSEGSMEFNSKFLQTGLSLQKHALLATIIDKTSGHVTVYADEEYIHKIAKNQRAEFVPQDFGLPSLAIVAGEINEKPLAVLFDPADTTSSKDVMDKLPLHEAYHSSNFGGRIVARPDKVFKPAVSTFKAKFAIAEKPTYPLQVIKGQVVLQVKEDPMLLKSVKQVINLVIREMGF